MFQRNTLKKKIYCPVNHINIVEFFWNKAAQLIKYKVLSELKMAKPKITIGIYPVCLVL